MSVVYFSPDELKLIKEVPEDRRNFLDVSISQFDKQYMFDLIRYDKILKQRNCVLKSNINENNKLKIKEKEEEHRKSRSLPAGLQSYGRRSR